MMNISQIQPEMPVVCAADQQFATVDHMEGDDAIKLKKDESGQHHYIPLHWVKSVENGVVHVDRACKAATEEWFTSANFPRPTV